MSLHLYARQFIQYINHFYQQNLFFFLKISFFQNFILFSKTFGEQCPNSDSETLLSQKLGQIESGAQWTQLGPACAPRRSHGRIVAAAVGRVVGTVAMSQALSRAVSQACDRVAGAPQRRVVAWLTV